MSFIDYALKLIGYTSTTPVTCPHCGFRSTQPRSKIRLHQAMMCPVCKTMFIALP